MKTVIFDLDNTLLIQTNRNPYDWKDLSGDKPIEAMFELMRMYANAGYYIVISTGRPERVRPQTENWLKENGAFYNKLYLNEIPRGKTVDHKEKVLISIQEKGYEVIMVFEDDAKCAEMYINHGVLTLSLLNYQVPKKEPIVK
jgi:hydroxymethylpyrimidine pyrophosphatase-like HAD family hydrolase